MGKSQRTKGAVYEREIAKRFSDALGLDCKRNIGQARDGGEDIPCGPFLIECKRRKTLTTIRKWYEQVVRATTRYAENVAFGFRPTPIVVMREDNGESMVVLTLDDFLALVVRAFA